MVQFLNRRFQSNAENMRFESLPNFPYYGIETALQDALTATVCHKNPGAGQRQKVSIQPVFTFNAIQGENGKEVSGIEVQEFLNTCIDTILERAQTLTFDVNGTLMVSMLDVVEMSVTENTITFSLEVYYLMQTEAEVPHFNYSFNPEEAMYSLTCGLTSPFYNPISNSTLALFNNQFNNPNCNPNLRWRQREYLFNNNLNVNPPHPSTYGAMLLPGFVFRLMYSRTITATLNPNLNSGPYTNYGAYNIWSSPIASSYTVSGWDMTLHRNGIAHRSMVNQPITLPNTYYDPTYYYIDDWAGQTPIHTGGTAAHEVAYTWQEWKWVAVPNPTYWTSITFEEGITSLLNP